VERPPHERWFEALRQRAASIADAAQRASFTKRESATAWSFVMRIPLAFTYGGTQHLHVAFSRARRAAEKCAAANPHAGDREYGLLLQILRRIEADDTLRAMRRQFRELRYALAPSLKRCPRRRVQIREHAMKQLAFALPPPTLAAQAASRNTDVLPCSVDREDG
jgi:hypothetical protein